jgi:hypothetical protein
MTSNSILAAIDAEIARLQQVRDLLSQTSSVGSTIHKNTKGAKPAKAKRRLTPEGRARIADAVKRRWAAAKKAAK